MTTKISTANIQPVTLAALAGGGGPKISQIVVANSSYESLDDTAVALEGGYIKLIGSGFEAGCQVLVGLTPATSVTFISDTEVRAQVPATAAGTYIVYLVNADGGTAIRINGITFSGTPTWTSNSALEGIVDTAISIQLTATDAATFALAAGSTLPPGVSLSSLGLLSGTITGITEETVYNFTINAVDSELQDSPRSFAFTVTSGDPYFNLTTLLLPGSATTFVSDASTNNFAVTVAGDTRPNNFNPHLTGWSNFFDGSGDDLTVPTNAAFTYGTGDFCIEGWFYFTGGVGGAGYSYIFGQGASTGAASLGLYIQNGVYKVWSGSTLITSAASFVQNSWVHLAVTRSGTTLRLFVNGIQSGSATNSNNITAGSTLGVSIGRWAEINDSNYITGYISNFRVVKGTAVYTTDFTPPTQPLEAISGTSLLTCQSNRFIDNSTNNYAITRTGDVAVRSFSPFLEPQTTNGSGYFDGTGDYLTATAGNLGSGDFTVEYWVYYTSLYDYISNLSTTRGSTGWSCGSQAAGQIVWYSSVAEKVRGTTAMVPNTWNHVAFVRSGGTLKGYLNGVQDGTTNTETTNFTDTSLAVGRLQDATPGEYFTGYMSDVRIVIGTAVYTANFTPPTSPLTAVANTSLLTLQSNQPHNNNQFLDSSSNNFPITRAGNATQGTSSPYSPAGWSNYFDGGTNRLTTAGSAIFNLSGINFTLECWIYMTAAPSVDSRLINIGPNNAQSSATLSINTSRQVGFSVPFSSGGGTGLSAALALNTWHHVAFVLSGSTGTLYINGVQSVQTTGWNITSSNSNYFYVGYDETLTVDGKFNGYVSNVRLVKGTAVYTGAFTPPTQPLTAIAGTAILTCTDNRIVDDSANNIAIGITGSVRVQNFAPFKAVTQTPTTYSAYFDASGNFLQVGSSNTGVTFGTADFTIEAWIYWNSLNSESAIMVGNGVGWTFYIYPDSKLQWGTTSPQAGANLLSSNTILNTGTWYHIAVTRASGTVTLWVNGVSDGTVTDSANYSASGDLRVGRSHSNKSFNGYMSNVRIVKGTAVYTADFTPPTAPLTAISGTSILTCQNPTFVDNSANSFAITAVGNTQPTTTNPFGSTFTNNTGYTAAEYSGSMYFDGSGDSLNLSGNAAFTMPGDFTAEAWVYMTAYTGSDLSTIFGFSKDDESTGWNILVTSTGKPHINVAMTYIDCTGTIPLNSWTHVALVRSGSGSGNVKLYLNGVADATTLTVTATATSPSIVMIGNYPAISSRTFSGYISNARIVKGQALYTSNFVPPAAPVQPVTNTVLLLNGTGAGITDATTRNVVETVGTARISTAVAKFDGSSMYFDGSGDRLIVPSSPNFDFPGDFTIEMWINFANVTSTWEAIISRAYALTGGWRLYKAEGNNQLIWYSNVTSVVSTSGSTLANNTWSHIAVVRNSGTLTIYIGGVNRGSAANATSYTPGNYALEIGEGVVSSAYPFEGYIQDLRITKHARYTANFTPPSRAFQTR